MWKFMFSVTLNQLDTFTAWLLRNKWGIFKGVLINVLFACLWQRQNIVTTSMVKKVCCAKNQGRMEKFNLTCFGFLTHEDGTDRLSQMLVNNYHYLLHNNPEECSSHLLHSRSLKPCLPIALALQNKYWFLYLINTPTNAHMFI